MLILLSAKLSTGVKWWGPSWALGWAGTAPGTEFPPRADVRGKCLSGAPRDTSLSAAFRKTSQLPQRKVLGYKGKEVTMS